MRYLTALLSRTGDFLVGLSETARKQLILLTLLIMGGWGIYKLVASIRHLSDPLPEATPEQLLQPMQKLFKPAQQGYSDYQHAQKQLDSLSKRS
jgi:hypothetical protein